jgi:hypothetical protein
MSHVISDRAGKTVYTAKPQWFLYLPFVIGGVVVGAGALELGLGTQIRTLFHIRPSAARDVALMLGGAAALVTVVAVGAWYCTLRWVRLSEDGIRWWINGSVYYRPWDNFAGIQRLVYEFQVEGKSTGQKVGAEVRFHTGPPLIVSPDLLHDYEGLLEALEAGPHGGRPKRPNPFAGRFFR